MNSKGTNIPTTQLTGGFEVPKIISGLWQIADMEREGELQDFGRLVTDMRSYAEAGLHTFDMADHYGSAEDICGAYRQAYQSELPIQTMTKWVPKPGPVSKETVKEAVGTSLKRLKTERIDMMQFHAWQYADPAWLDALFYLQELKEEGLIKHLGLTNFDTAHLRMVVKSGIEVVSNQVCFSLLDMRAAGAMTQLCQETGVKLFAFGTLAGGFLSDRWLGQAEPPLDESLTWSQMKYKRFMDLATDWNGFQSLLQVLSNIGQRHGVSVANVATRYMIQQPAVAAVLIGTRLGESNRMADNLKLFDFVLNPQDLEDINAVLAGYSAIPGDCGDEYRKPPFLTASGDLSHHFERFPPPYPTVAGNDGRTKALSGTVWEDMAGYSRAIRKGNTITVSGTTATHGDMVIGSDDPNAQAHFVIDKIEGALLSLGSSLEDVIRTRIFVTRLEDWEPVARAHGERFAGIQPANTLVQAQLVGDEYLVEIEADALVND